MKSIAIRLAILAGIVTIAAYAHAEDPRPERSGVAKQSPGALQPPKAQDSPFHVAPGFRVELVYKVPREQGSWVCMTIDPKGRLIASDQDGKLYRLSMAAGQVEKVEPLEIDLGRAQGLVCAFDSLYVVMSHQKSSGLYRARDTDGDDQYDNVQLLRAFDGDGEHGPHGVVVGPDKKSLYIAGGNGSKLPAPEKSRMLQMREDRLLTRIGASDGEFDEQSPGAWICRTDADGTAFELVAMGLRNPYDLAFNPDGELFTYDSDMEWDMGTPWYRPTRICHLVSGADFGWRAGTSKWPEYYVDSLPPVVEIGAGSPTGIVFGTGAKYPAKYQRALFIADWSHGNIYAVHLMPQGSSYTGTFEPFLSGTPLPVTDLEIHPADGWMYFTVGGRGATSAVYRVVYAGEESTAMAAPEEDERFTTARATRRKLEQYHGEPNPAAIEAAWHYLSDSDAFIRYAARLVVERQPVGAWRARALGEEEPRPAIAALAALARCDGPASAAKIVAALGRLDWSKLPRADRLDLLRAYQLVLCRAPSLKTATRGVVRERLQPLFPQYDPGVNRELAELLAHLKPEGLVERLLVALEQAASQEEAIHYAQCLNELDRGWTLRQRRRLLQWYAQATAAGGGVTYNEYIEQMRARAVAGLSKSDRDELADLLKPPAETSPYERLQKRPLVNEWTVETLVRLVERGVQSGDTQRGRQIFGAALCSKCHRFAGQGGFTGPDLTTVVSRFDTRTLVEAIVEPSKVIPDQYSAITIIDIDGRTHTGRIGDLQGEEVMLKVDLFNPANVIRIKRSRMESMEKSKTSMMPSGLLNTFREEEILDLFAYLRSQGRNEVAGTGQ